MNNITYLQLWHQCISTEIPMVRSGLTTASASSSARQSSWPQLGHGAIGPGISRLHASTSDARILAGREKAESVSTGNRIAGDKTRKPGRARGGGPALLRSQPRGEGIWAIAWQEDSTKSGYLVQLRQLTRATTKSDGRRVSRHMGDFTQRSQNGFRIASGLSQHTFNQARRNYPGTGTPLTHGKSHSLHPPLHRQRERVCSREDSMQEVAN